MLAQHWIPFAIVASIIAFVFLPRMRKKDQSLSRYPEFAAYKERSGLLLPKLFVDKSATQSAKTTTAS